MQTFLPFKSFLQSVEALDTKRLGKQRIEAAQILEVLLKKPFLLKTMMIPLSDNDRPWKNHPAVLMWKGHEEWLKLYLACCIGEWCDRNYTNNIEVPEYNTDSQAPPRWLGFELFHQSHRSKLFQKDPVHYREFWQDGALDLPYFWPTRDMK